MKFLWLLMVAVGGVFSIGADSAYARECRVYRLNPSTAGTQTPAQVELCREAIPGDPKPRLVQCKQKNCGAKNFQCSVHKTKIPGNSPLAMACHNCFGKVITGTNIQTRNEESLCRFSDGSWALSYDVFTLQSQRH